MGVRCECECLCLLLRGPDSGFTRSARICGRAAVLIAGGRAVEEAVDAIRAAFADRPHIFNLGHGILPDTPIAHVEALLSYVRQQGDCS